MRADEQLYPIDKPADPEDVTRLSAFQVRYLVLAADPEALFAAAQDYLCTAERLDATADGIRQGATDLADTWHSTAAAASQQHLRQYYASARSLAAACRACVATLSHAATALAATQLKLHYLPTSGPFPSPDPTSIESRLHQKLLADLNSAYRDALTLAPTQLAISLPPGDSAERYSPTWEDLANNSSLRADKSGIEGDSRIPANSPQRLPPVIPANPSTKSNRTATWLVEDPLTSNRPSLQSVWHSGDPEGGAHSLMGTPYGVNSMLAGAPDGIGQDGGPYGSDPRPAVSPEAVKSGSGESSTDGSGASDVRRKVGGLASTAGSPGNSTGMYPPGQGEREDGRERERRYYLKEEREVWGESDALPPVLYGECPRSQSKLDDDDDDF